MRNKYSLDRSTTPQRIADSLRQKIAVGELMPGTRLHEVAFTEAFGVSRHTFREAISILVREGLLTRNSFKGVEVTELTPEDVHDIYQARRAIELPAVDALAQAGPEVRDAVLAAIEEFLAMPPTAESEAIHAADSAVHLALAAVHGSRRLKASYAGLLAELEILLFTGYDDSDRREADEAHLGFLQLVKSGHYSAARTQLEGRLRRAEDQLVQSLRKRAAAAGER